MKDVIVNGKFSQGGVFSTSNWIIHNVKLAMPTNPYLSTIFYLEGKSDTYSFNTVPPGIYQKINISSDYKTGAKINFKYLVTYKSEVALNRKETLNGYFYIYRIDPNYSGNTIRPVGNVRTYYEKRKISIYYDEYDASQGEVLTEENEVNVTLGPGDYVIGFGADYIGVSGTFMSDANKITGLGVSEIEGLIENVPELEDNLPFITKDFQGFDKELTPDESYYLPVERDGMDLGIKCSNLTIDQQIQNKDGIWADFRIEPYTDEDPDDLVYTGRISFWHRCESGVTGDFAIYVYDKDTGHVWFNKKIKVTNYWSFCIEEFDIWDGQHEILIIPPKNTSTGDKYFIVNNIDLTLRIDSKLEGSYPPEGSGGDGTYGNPYNENDGYIGYRIDVSGSKVSYVPRFVTDMPLKSQVYYVRIKNKYYMTKGTQTHYLCANGFYDLNGSPIEDPINPTDLSGKVRHFQINGEMTHNEYFCINGDDIYIADDRGVCYYSCKVLKSMNLSINNLPITGKDIIDIPRAKTIDITATFEEQCPSILLKIMSSDENVIKCVGVSEDAYSGLFGYKANKSNTLTIQGVNTGIATIIVSYESITGSIVETSFIMEVRNQLEYPANIEIDLAYKQNYIYYGQEYTIKHRVRPIISSDVPLYWYVDRDDIFSVTNDGVIKVKDGVAQPSETTTTANITIINYGSGLVETCEIHMLRYENDLSTPVKVNIMRNNQEYTSKTYTMTVGDKADFRDITVDTNGNSTNVFQNVRWFSDDSSIVMVDQFGSITALKEGKVKIHCSCQQAAYVGSWVEIDVQPDEESLKLRGISLNTSKAVIFNSEDDYSNRYSEEYLSCIYIPENTRQTGVVWTSDNPSIAKVDEAGRVYCDPVSDENNGASTIIRCTSIHNSALVATCEVVTYNWETFEPIVWFSTHEFNASLNETISLRYFFSSCDYIEYIKDSTMVRIERYDGVQTVNTVSFNENTRKVFVDVNEVGEFKITISMQYKKLGDDKIYYITDTCMMESKPGTYAPTITKNLETLYALHDGSYVLRYNVVNDIAENFECYLIIDETQSLAFAEPLMYNGERYFYIFEKMKYPGTFNVQVKIVNNGIYTATTGTVSVTIPENEDNQESLSMAKANYDIATDDIISFISTLLTDMSIKENEKSEFETRFKIYNINYNNLKTMLDMCIEFIDQQIKEDQATMSTMATALASDGIEMAAYSVEENTNSNYSNVTDMDYYQNECIKALVQRVLELEARLDYLSNNNDN